MSRLPADPTPYAPPARVHLATAAQREAAVERWFGEEDGKKALAWVLDAEDPDEQRRRLAGLLPEIKGDYQGWVSGERARIEDVVRGSKR